MTELCLEQVEMWTPFKICVFAPADEEISFRFEAEKSFRKLREINSWMSEWQPETDLSRVNGAAGARPVSIRKELFELLRYTQRVSEETEGGFDPTFNAFWGLYDFKAGRQREPTPEEIRERLPLIDWRKLALDEATSTAFLKAPGMKLGLGGLGQGYGVDIVAGALRKRYSAGFVDGSGDTYFWGKKPSGELWTAAIRDPRDHSKTVARLYGTDFAITTAGDDEKFFMVGDRRVHHIIDPKTGRSATGSRQVTIVASTALDADAYDDGCFVMGPKKAKDLIERKGFRGVIVTDDAVTFAGKFAIKKTQWGDVRVVDGVLR